MAPADISVWTGGLSTLVLVGCAFGLGRWWRSASPAGDPRDRPRGEPETEADSWRFDSGEWRRVEEALRDSEEKYRVLIENANDAICVAQDGVVKFFNPKMQAMLGYNAQQLSTTPFLEIIAPEDRPMVQERYVRRLRGEDVPHQYEFRFLTHAGRLLWIEINSVLINWERRPAALCFFRDINEQKRTEAALRDSEAMYHSLVESLPLSIFRKDAEGRIEFANRRFCDLLGKPLEELAGKTDFDLFPRELAEKYRRDDAQVLASGRVWEDVEEHRKSDGELIYVQILKAPVLDAEGQVRGVQGMFWDVSARRRAEEKLRESADRTRLILDTAYDAFVAIDAAGRIVDWNPQAEATFGWSREEAIGRPVAETIIPGPFREAYGRRLGQFLARGEGPVLNKRIEITALRRDGSEFPVEVAIAPMRLGDTHIFHAFLHDISRRKQYESDLKYARDAAEAANRAKSAFLANMSHEIRTPMNAIIGMAELVLDTSLEAEQRDYLKLVLESADSLLSIINDLLDFSKIEAGKFDLDPVAFDLHESIGDTLKSLAVRAHKKGLELIHDIGADVPQFVVGDPHRLRQVVINLVGNAIKFTDRGEVVMSVHCESQSADDLLLHFAVRDTGIGVPADKRDLIFKAFEQADSSTTRRFGGTGLGLAISAALVDLMGGRVWVESEVGQGSVFHFTADFARASQTDGLPTAATAAAHRLDGMRILVVDDNATNRRIQVEILRNWRMQPLAVETADEALCTLREAHRTGQPFTLVISDSNMPEVDGFELARRIKADPDLRGAIIMMLTSGDRPDDVTRCRELGIAAYLMKPIKQSELFDAIAAAVGLATIEEAAGPADQAPRESLRILLAEDSLVNQKLAVGLLTRQGHQVAVANNGREALAKLAAGGFDLVLMDVQMPEMDGLEATKALRRDEPEDRHLPVIAMTAHAMKGDRERCLAAGMDNYISKPIRANDLFATIEQVMRAARAGQAPPAVPEPDDPIDWSVALDSVGGDRELLREIIAAFLDEAPRLLAELTHGLHSGNAEIVHRSAHTLKGSMRYFGAAALFDQAYAVEKLGHDGALERAAEPAATLDASLRRLFPRLEQYLRSEAKAVP